MTNTEWFITCTSGNLVSNAMDFNENPPRVQVYVEGYATPRMSEFERLSYLNQEELVEYLFEKHNTKCIDFLKGSFTIIIYKYPNLYVFSDRHNLRTCFLYQKDSDFILSNSIKLISDSARLQLDRTGAAMYFLTSHYLCGRTFFEDVRTLLPGTLLSCNTKAISMYSYWDPSDLFRKDKASAKEGFPPAGFFKEMVQQQIEYLCPDSVSVTLTGGHDSRMVFAALLSNDISCQGFTFGSPESIDGVISKNLADTAGVSHSMYDVCSPSVDWFAIRSREIVDIGQSAVNIHRAHRLEAFLSEARNITSKSMIATGLMGGEYNRCPGTNERIVPYLFRKIIDGTSDSLILDIVVKQLREKHVKVDEINLQGLVRELKAYFERYVRLNEAQQLFVLTYLFYGCAHHSQDPILMNNLFGYAYHPFMDIDYLDRLAMDRNWYVNKAQPKLYGYFFDAYDIVKVTHELAPQLSSIPYAKWGMYTAEDMVNHKSLHVLKRSLHFIRKRDLGYPPNFRIGSWMRDFCLRELDNIPKAIESMMDIDGISRDFCSAQTPRTEYEWLKLTGVINAALNYSRYAQ
ncbi:MAG: hypothetical protein PHE01_00855 [Methanosarcina sp.]|nr:hypothetical protein [Methanosarcina sp.]